MARSSVVKAEGRGLSPQGQVHRSSRSPRSLLAYCRTLLAAPTAELVTDAQRFAIRILDYAAGYAASALSLLGTVEIRCEEVHHGQRLLGDALRVLDACSRLPARFLLAPGLWEGPTVRDVLVGAVRHAVSLAAALDRAARELGLEPFDGGPFAVASGSETPALPGRPLLLGGAR